jgi:putative transposase
MKGSRFNEEQIIGVLREHEAGAKTEEVCRRHGISSATFYIYGRLPRGKKVSGSVACLPRAQQFRGRVRH